MPTRRDRAIKSGANNAPLYASFATKKAKIEPVPVVSVTLHAKAKVPTLPINLLYLASNIIHKYKATTAMKPLYKNTFHANIDLKLNGHDRFKAQEPNYFHLIQPYETQLGNGFSMNNTSREWQYKIDKMSKNYNTSLYSFALNYCQ